MSYFRIIVPEETTNLFLDPSFEAASITTSWDVEVGSGNGSAAKTTTDQWVGANSALVTFGTSTNLLIAQEVTVTATSYTIQAMVKRSAGGVPASTHTKVFFNESTDDWDSITLIESGWYHCVYTANFGAGAIRFGVYVLEDGMFIDAMQFEQKAYPTTYCDGSLIGHRDTDDDDDTYGYQWNGTANASTSTRHAQERSGGRVRDVVTDLGSRKITFFAGVGMPAYQHQRTPYAALPGSSYEGTKIPERIFDLGLFFREADFMTFLEKRLLLENAVKLNLVFPEQPYRLRFVTDRGQLELDAFYEGGLEFNNVTSTPTVTLERVALRSLVPDPYWRGLKTTTTALTVNSATNVTYSGTEQGFPILRLEGDGTVDSLANSTTGLTINFGGLVVFSGEVVLLDLRPGHKSLTSDLRGSIYGAITTGSDVGSWYLANGTNSVTLTASAGAYLVTQNGNNLITQTGDRLVVGNTLNLTVHQLECQERHETISGVVA